MAKKRMLIISNGPVPVMAGVKIEGSGQRCWGLATGMGSNGYEVTVAVRDHYKIRKVITREEISLLNWTPGKKLAELANRYDLVVISYSMGKIAADLSKHLKKSVSLILDCYVPIYVELSARNAKDRQQALANYLVDHAYFNTSLMRGDYFLCANQPQKHFYTGVLSALGIINPFSYNHDRVIELPFGVDSAPVKSSSNPYSKLGVPKEDFILLWFGGLYPWFDITSLLKSVDGLRGKNKSISLVIVGGKNPYNNNIEFVQQYEKAVSYSKEKSLYGRGIHFVDWVDYDERINWYSNADAVININSPGKENEYSWRTRIMDYVWGEVGLLTNGGDPLSEHLLDEKAALRIPSSNQEDLAEFLAGILEKPLELKKARDNITSVKKQYFWEELTKPLDKALLENLTPHKLEYEFRKSMKGKMAKTKLISHPGGKPLRTLQRLGRKIRRQ